MSTMIIHGRWYAIEGILAATAFVLCLAIILPTDSRYSDDTFTDTESQDELTRRGTRSTTPDYPGVMTIEERVAFNSDSRTERRRVRADAEVNHTGDASRPYSNGRNRLE